MPRLLLALVLVLLAPPLLAQRPDTTGRIPTRPDSAGRDSARISPRQGPPPGPRELPRVRVTAPGEVAPPSPLVQGTATTVVGAERLVTMPSRVLPDALREVPGVQVQQTNAGHGTAIVRGLTGNQVLVVADGIRLNGTTVRDGPSQYLATLDPESVASLEVIRGPGSVLFGSDAIGGVVHVRTRRPAARSGWRAATTASSADGGVRGSVGGDLAGRRLRASASASLTAADEVVAGGDIGAQPRTGYRARGADAAMEWDVARCTRLDLGARATSLRDVQRFDRLFAYRAPAPGPDAEFTFEPQRFARALARLVREQCDGRIAAASVTGGAQWQDEGRLDRPRDGTSRRYARDDLYTRFATAWAEPRLPPGTIVRVGMDAYDDRVSSGGWVEAPLPSGAMQRTPTTRIAGDDTVPAGRFPNGARHVLLGGYVHASRLVGARARLLGGARWDRSHVRLRAGDDFGGDVDAATHALSGQLGASVLLGGGIIAGATAGRGFRAPNTYDLATVTSAPGGVVLPSAGLGPERSTTVEASLARAGRGTDASVVVHATRIADLVDRVPGTYRGDTLFDGDRVFRAANVARARLVGVEASFAAALPRALAVRAQGSWTRGTQWAGDTARGEPMARIPPVSGSLALRRALATRAGDAWIEVASRGALAQRRLSSRDRRDSRIAAGGTPGFVTVGARAGVARGAWRIAAGAENLGDRGYREHGSGIDAPGRHAWLRLERRTP